MTVTLLLLFACIDDPAKPPEEETGTAGDSGDTDGEDTDTEETDTEETDTDTAGDTSEDTGAPAWEPRRGDLLAADDTLDATDLGRPAVGDLDGDGVDELVFPTDVEDEPFRIVRYDAYAGTRDTISVIGVKTRIQGKAWIAGEHLILGIYSLNTTYVFHGLPSVSTLDITTAPTVFAFGVDDVLSGDDFDGDGVGDVVLQVSDSGDLAFFAGPLPSGELSLEDAFAVVTGLDVRTTRFVAPGDLDGDGTPDLVIDGAVLFGPVPEGTSRFEDLATTPITFAWPFETPWYGALGDGDGDGRDDLLVVDSARISLLHGVDAGTSPVVPDVALECESGITRHSIQTLLGGIDGDADGLAGLGFVGVGTDTSRSLLVWHDAPAANTSCAAPDLTWVGSGSAPDWAVSARLGGPARGDILWSDGRTISVIRGWGAPGADADRDGHGADDCDDADPTVFPFAAERTDGRDEDCDGVVDDGADRVEALAAGPALVGGAGNQLGLGLAAWDHGGGASDLVVVGVTERGPSVWIVPPDRTLGDAAAERYTTASGLEVSLLGDIDGDGLDDLGVAPNYGDTWILPGGALASGELGTGATDVVWSLEETDSDAGETVSPAGDVDGDGLADVLVGGASTEFADWGTSTVYLLLGGPLGGRTATDADARFDTSDGMAGGTRRGANVGDLDGDGRDDVAFTTGTNLRVMAGMTSGTHTWDEATTTFETADIALAGGDLDGDGFTELYVTDGWSSIVYGFTAPLPAGTLDASAATVTMTSREGGDFGATLAVSEGASGLRLLVGAPESDGAGIDAGRLWSFAGPLVGTLDDDDAVAGWEGADAVDLAGTSFAPLDIDGIPSIAIGAPRAAGVLGDDGAVWVVGLR
ncbi:MAG: putative metal-binding motif-containing protein [Myxococcota bacterium]